MPVKSQELTDIDTKNLVEKFCSEIETQLQERSDLESKWDRWHKAYEAEPRTARKTSPWDGASNLVIALSAIYTDSVVARIMQGVFSIEPHWVGTQLNRKVADNVKPLERYLDWCRTNMWDQYKVVKPAVLEMIKLGTSFIYNGYKDQKQITFGTDGAKTVTQVKGPCPEWVPRADILCASGYVDLQSAPWIARRPWYSWQDLQALSYAGFFPDLTPLKGHSDTDTKTLTVERHTSVPVITTTDDDSFGLWGPWQVWFKMDLDDDGYPEDYIMFIHLKSKSMMRFQSNPYVNGLRTFVRMPFVEVEGKFDGLGIPGMIEQHQEEVSTQHNQRIDNQTLNNSPVLAVRKGSGITDKERFRLGKFWFVTDPMSDIKEFKFSTSTPQSITNEQLTIQLAEKRIGMTDVNQGQTTPAVGRAAAATVMAVLQEGTRRFDLNTSELRNALTEEGLQILDLFQTHGLPDPTQPGSPEQVLDEQDAALVRQLIETPDGIRGLVGLKLNVATAAVNKEIEKQSNLQLLGVVTNYFDQFKNNLMQLLPILMNPQTPPALKQIAVHMAQGIDKMMSKVFQSHAAFDLDDILMGDILAQLIGGEPSAGLPTNVAPVEGGPGGANPISSQQDGNQLFRQLLGQPGNGPGPPGSS